MKILHILCLTFLVLTSNSDAQIIRTPESKMKGIILVDENGGAIQSINGVNFHVIEGNPNWNILSEVPAPSRTLEVETSSGTYTSTPNSPVYNFNVLNKEGGKDVTRYINPFLGISNDSHDGALILEFDSPSNLNVDIRIVDIKGTIVKEENNVHFNKGKQRHFVDATSFNTGVYIVSFSSSDLKVTTKYVKD